MRKIQVLLLSIFITNVMMAQTLEEAKTALNNENFIRAKNILTKLVAGGADKKAAYYLGNAYLRLEDADSAKIFYTIASTDGKTANAYLAQGRLALLANDKTAAKAAFERASIASKMKDAEVLFQAGEAFYKPTTTDLQEAIKYFEDAYRIDVKHYANMLMLGDAYLDNNEGGKAMSKYESTTDLNKNIALPYIKIGRLNTRARIYDDAIKAYDKAIQIDPKNPLPYWEIGEAYYLSKQYDKAKTSFEKYVELNTEDAEAKLKLITLLYQLKDYDEVIKQSSKMLETDPNNYVLNRALFYANYEKSRYKEGYEAMQNFWKNAPAKKVKPFDYIYSAKLASQMGDTAQSFKYYEEAVKASPKNAELAGEYAKALFTAKQYSKAAEQYNNLINNLGGTSLDYYYLGRAQYSLKNYLACDSAFTKFVEKNPTSPDGYKWRAKANSQMDPEMKSAAAKPYYEKFIEVAKGDVARNKKDLVESYNYLGAYYLNAKNNELAKSNFSQSLAIDPADSFANEMMKGLK